MILTALKKKIDTVPVHMAIIMDGNGRWAKNRALPRNFGHKQGVKTVERVTKYCLEYGVKVLSLYAFSTENWSRPDDEVSHLFSLIAEYFDKSKKEFIEKGVKVRVLGEHSKLSAKLIDSISDIENATSGFDNLLLNICFNYGSRTEIVSTVNSMIAKGIEITESSLLENLYTSGAPEPDLLVRTSGEMRLSNFMLYQLAYAELYFTDTLWPDFNRKEFEKALFAFAMRNRRFGNLK